MGGGGSAALVPPQPQVPSIPCSVPLARAVISFFFRHQGALSQAKRPRLMTLSSEW